MITAADILVKIGTQGADTVSKELGGLGKTVDSAGKSMMKFGGLMTLGVTTPLMLMGKAMISGASDLNETVSKNQQVFEGSSGSILKWGDSAANAFGMSKNEALSAAASYGNMFRTMGLGAGASATLSENLVQNAADLASFNNASPAETLQAIQSGLVGEAEPLRRFGILLNESAVAAKAQEMGLADANGELTESAKVQARAALIAEQMGKAQGDFARTSDGLANQQRILRAKLIDTSAAIGKIMLPMALKAVGIFSKLVDGFAKIPQPLQKAVVIFGVFAAAIGPILTIFGALAVAAGVLLSPILLIGGALAILAIKTGIVGDAIDWLKTTFHDASMALKAFDLSSTAFDAWMDKLPGPVQSIVNLIIGLRDAFGDLGDAWQALGEGNLSEVFDELGEAAHSAIGPLKDFASAIGQQLVDAITGINFAGAWDTLVSTIKGVASKGIELGAIALSAAAELAGDLADMAADKFVPWLKKKLGVPADGSIGDLLGAGATALASAAVNLGGDLADIAAQGAGWLTSKLFGGFSGAGDGTGGPEPGGSPWGVLLDDLLDLGTHTVKALLELGGDLLDIGAKIKNKIAEKMPTTKDFYSIGENLGTLVHDGIASAISAVGGLAGIVINALTGGGSSGSLQQQFPQGGGGGLGERILGFIEASIKGVVGADARIAAAIGGFFKGLIFGDGDIDFSSLVGSLLGKLTTAIESFGGFASAIAGKLAIEMMQAAGDLPGLIGDFGPKVAGKLKDAIVSGISGFVDFASNIKNALVTEFTQSIPSIGELADTASDMIGNLASALVDAVPEAFGALKDAIIGWIGDHISPDEIWEAVKSAGKSVDPWSLGGLSGNNNDAPAYEANGRAAGEAFLRGLNSAANSVGVNSSKDSAGFGQAILQNIPERFGKTGKDSGTGFNTNLSPGLTTANTFLGTTSAQMVGRLTQFVSQSGQQGKGAGSGFNTGLSGGLKDAANATNTGTGQMAGKMTTFTGQAGTQGRSAGSGFSTGIGGGMTSANNLAAAGISRIRGALGSLGNASSIGYSIGASFGQGILSGISAYIGSIASAAANAVNAAENAARSAADSHSPSKLFAALGRDLMLGAAMGVNQAAPLLAGATAGAITGSANGISSGYGAPLNRGTVIINYHFALKSDELVDLFSDAQAGADVARNLGRELRYW